MKVPTNSRPFIRIVQPSDRVTNQATLALRGRLNGPNRLSRFWRQAGRRIWSRVRATQERQVRHASRWS